ncbi:MAG: hypothetical protein WEB30_16670 [Cyclobacteriaceae bacterium]
MKHLITYFEIAAFVASLLALPVLRRSKYLRLFPLLLFIIVTVEIQQTFFWRTGANNAAIYNLQVPLQHLLYLYILYLAMYRQSFKTIIGTLIIIFIVITVITGIFFTAPDRFNISAYCAGSVAIIAGILLKFYELLENPLDFNFLRNPFFYMLFAFLFFNVGTLPYFTMSNWLHFLEAPENTKLILVSVMSVFNYILYTTYSLAFLWMILKGESSLSAQR